MARPCISDREPIEQGLVGHFDPFLCDPMAFLGECARLLDSVRKLAHKLLVGAMVAVWHGFTPLLAGLLSALSKNRPASPTLLPTMQLIQIIQQLGTALP